MGEERLGQQDAELQPLGIDMDDEIETEAGRFIAT